MQNSPVPRNTAIDDALLDGSTYSRIDRDVLDHILYDRLLFQAATVRPLSNFFTVPIGGAFGAGVKTLTETNMTDPGKLPSGQKFLIKEISLGLIPVLVPPADVDMAAVFQSAANIVQQSIFEINVPGREYDWQNPGTVFYPSHYGIGNSTVIDATNRIARVGDFVNPSWIKLSTPILIGDVNGSPVSFKISQQTGSAITAINTILNTASALLEAQVAAIEIRLRGTLRRMK
jgi:hypothetical protein